MTEFTWSTKREGNLGYVHEVRPDGSSQTFEMPAHLVPFWLNARRNYVKFMMAQQGYKKSDPPLDMGYLK